MTKTKTQQAQEYADRKFPTLLHMIEKAYFDGYTACEQSMWRSVEKELPENRDYVLTHVPQFITSAYCEVAYWDNEDWYTQDGELIRPDYWMPIPSLPDTKTEKK